jgi:hypothetical protein
MGPTSVPETGTANGPATISLFVTRDLVPEASITGPMIPMSFAIKEKHMWHWESVSGTSDPPPSVPWSGGPCPQPMTVTAWSG